MERSRTLSEFGDITYSRLLNRKDAVYAPIPIWLNDKTVSILSENGINLLYGHQRKAVEAVFNNDNVVISTGTSSGKSLCYQIPLIEMLLSDENASAIMVFLPKL